MFVCFSDLWPFGHTKNRFGGLSLESKGLACSGFCFEKPDHEHGRLKCGPVSLAV